ncbi:MAG: Nramp family divalent metal transporter [Planctomycetes bacterium]|nr:Nramp family divalent metal transporter [Planctomycetota bacterium]MCH9725629.1 Nramp family divalent metal transporter [Planctomycetota bacterium]MCH9777683.1 Nramp family divalent metal transporter [Planctomycetota bacterium]MCH9792873.1 Nramp family divalent metal transporter [Planctomycetota bacterium]
MSDQSNPDLDEELVPDEIIPHQSLPPLKYKDMPPAISWRKMIGPSIMLAGLSLGSGEFVLWPYITYKTGFIFFWACLLGVITQFFMNMEIERWTLATGESAITGFCRLNKNWAWVMLLLNIIPWAWPGWATGAGTMLSWTFFGPETIASVQVEPAASPFSLEGLPENVTYSTETETLKWRGPMDESERDTLSSVFTRNQSLDHSRELFNNINQRKDLQYEAKYSSFLGIAGLLLVGIVLTTGPVVYNTVEKIQIFLVGMIFLIAVILGIYLIEPYAITSMIQGSVSIGKMPDESSGLTTMALLGALAFAGAGGTMNLGQSNFIKDKGYGMGKYIGRITSPITGQEEAVSEVGYHFKHTDENQKRWQQWWRAANIEHFFSFFLTCLACLVLLSLISYSLFYDANGQLKEGVAQFGSGLNFIWGQATLLEDRLGGSFKLLFLLMGAAILLTTELGVLDVTARISADILKVNYLRDNERWSLSKLYYTFLWSEILLGSAILMYGLINPLFKQPLFLIETSAAMNGGVMFLYSMILLYMNSKILSRSISTNPLRFVAMVWAAAFFGYFSIQAFQVQIIPYFQSILTG